jgi:hypothetical protein
VPFELDDPARRSPLPGEGDEGREIEDDEEPGFGRSFRDIEPSSVGEPGDDVVDGGLPPEDER